MTFKEIEFKDINSTRIYRNYLGRIRNSIKNLNPDNQQELLLEINSHIYEAFNYDPGQKGELEHLLDVMDKLGPPEVFLKPWVVQKQLEEATQSFNPVKIFKALFLNLGNGISYILFVILYLCLFGFVFLIVAKILNPDQVGLFYRVNDFFILGQYRETDINSYLPYEHLGNWFIPVMMVATALLYFLLTLLLKLKKTFKLKLS